MGWSPAPNENPRREALAAKAARAEAAALRKALYQATESLRLESPNAAVGLLKDISGFRIHV